MLNGHAEPSGRKVELAAFLLKNGSALLIDPNNAITIVLFFSFNAALGHCRMPYFRHASRLLDGLLL
jgi:hypothetical protein